ncbi:hypothetical protein GZH47_33520 (plasmid) [Paenibacillus rhizovicinus]|uniref:Uncharacterized protein n=1 Tax=Paenibacillus rhizovicinus TaxID=2704463 RepID=A0A6C0PB63_9BACL|nr:hypothetical protein [Paenibacillus rhizovicinus]QHW35814.1 hypothetical protein GZH47_33520 [Paenibacillus rhizovicinus]
MPDLFDFDYTIELTEEVIQESLQGLILHFKASGNSHSVHMKDREFGRIYQAGGESIIVPGLNGKIRMCIPELEKRGHCHRWNGSSSPMLHLNDELRDFQDPEEIAAKFRAAADRCLAAGGDYYTLYSIRTNISIGVSGPGIDKAITREMDRLAVELGFRHYKEKPKALGMRINHINKKNKPIIEAIFEAMKPMKDHREARQFFDSHAFQDPSRYGDGSENFITLMPSVFDCQCLIESDNIKDTAEILAHIGGSWWKPENEGRLIIRTKDDVYDTIMSEPDDDVEDENEYRIYEDDDIDDEAAELEEDHHEADSDVPGPSIPEGIPA